MNSSTGGTTKDGNKWGIVKGAGTVISGAETTAHNCYGVGTELCKNDGLLKDGKPMNWESVYQPQDLPNQDDRKSIINETIEAK